MQHLQISKHLALFIGTTGNGIRLLGFTGQIICGSTCGKFYNSILEHLEKQVTRIRQKLIAVIVYLMIILIMGIEQNFDAKSNFCNAPL